jgi:hypothetical protein
MIGARPSGSIAASISELEVPDRRPTGTAFISGVDEHLQLLDQRSARKCLIRHADA